MKRSKKEDGKKENKHDETGHDEEQQKKHCIYSCDICDKRFTKPSLLARHKRSHGEKLRCLICSSEFTRADNLRVHCKKFHPQYQVNANKPKAASCDQCGRTFHSSFRLRRHKQKMHAAHLRDNVPQYQCRHCEQEFTVYSDLFNHVTQRHPLNQAGGRDIPRDENTLSVLPSSDNQDNYSEKNNSTSDPSVTKERTNDRVQETKTSFRDRALNDAIENHYIYPKNNDKYDVLVFLANMKNAIRNYILSRSRNTRGIKWNLCIQVLMRRDDEEQNTSSPYFRSNTYRLLDTDSYNEQDLNEAMQKMHASMEKYLREGSGWYVVQVIKLEIHTVKYSPISGSTFIPLPVTLSKSHSVLNIANFDEKCFLYCILASLHPADNIPENVLHYTPYENELDMTGMEYPVTLSQVQRFEKRNQNISVNVFAYEDKDIVPLRITEHSERLHHVNLLLLHDEDKSHYCLITDLDRFLSRTSTHSSRLYYCAYCLHGFTRPDLLTKHTPYCKLNGPQKVELPSPEDNILRFKDYQKTLKVSFTIYCDFETLNKTIDTCEPNPEHANVLPSRKLEVCGYGYRVVCQDPKFSKPTVVYRGPDASSKLIDSLLAEAKEINDILSHPKELVMTEEDQKRADDATTCCICDEPFSLYDEIYNRRVKHHCHLRGTFFGLAHNQCNLKCTVAKHIPVVFHNLKNFDAHILCESIGRFKDHKLSCIAQTTEKYVSFSLGNLKFIDSFQFLSSSLETLVDNLAKDGLTAMPHLKDEIDSEEKALLLMRKQVYPYEYFTCFEKFQETRLPPKEAFFSSLTRKDIDEKDYQHALKVYEVFELESLGQFHDLYLKSDVILLCDVFEAFRDLSMKQYGLDPCHFMTSAGLAWAACLKMTKVSLELLTDIQQILFIERGVRGGCSQISHRYARANHAKIDNYDPSQPASYLMYLDMNNLYGWAMCQPLPVGSFRWKTEQEIEQFRLFSIPEDNEYGFILEVTLDYPIRCHDRHNDYPLAPEQKIITDEELSPYARTLWKKLHGYEEKDEWPPRGKSEKLVLSLDRKEKYIVHYRNLQLYLNLGMQLVTIHRILEFRQSPWMKKYIDFNTQKRKEATTAFARGFYKLLNVSVYGKTMENVRKHRNIELVHTERRLGKLVSKPTYKTSKIFSEDLIAVELNRNKVLLNKPSYSGMCILDLSKVIMYEFYYMYLKNKYEDKLQLLMTDTDSFLFHCETDDIYQDMMTDKHLFDFSDYPKDHPMQNDENKKVLGKMKDESSAMPISEFVGLRSKLYAFKCNNCESKRAKGISRVTVKKDLRFEHYFNTLKNETKQLASMVTIRSHNHELFSEHIVKQGLSCFDDKRFLVDAINSFAYGHYKIAGVKYGCQIQAIE